MAPSPESPTRYPFLLLTVGGAHEIWVWIISGMSDRLRALAEYSAEPGCRSASTLRFEERLLRRLQGAFEYFVQNRPAYYSRWSWEWWDGLARTGVDEVGLALFSGYLVNQERYWGEVARQWPGKVEASGVEIVRALSTQFHQRLALSPDEVARRRADLYMEEELRASKWTCSTEWHGVTIQRPEEGFLTREELDERKEFASDLLEQLAARKEQDHV